MRGNNTPPTIKKQYHCCSYIVCSGICFCDLYFLLVQEHENLFSLAEQPWVCIKAEMCCHSIFMCVLALPNPTVHPVLIQSFILYLHQICILHHHNHNNPSNTTHHHCYEQQSHLFTLIYFIIYKHVTSLLYNSNAFPPKSIHHPKIISFAPSLFF